MKNFIASGDVVTVSAPAGGVASGQFVRLGALQGVAQSDAASGDAVALVTSGIFELEVAAVTAVTVGAEIFWDGEKLTTAADTLDVPNAFAGVAVSPAAQGAAVLVDVKI